MEYKAIEDLFDVCKKYLNKLNSNQRGAMYEYFKMTNKGCDHFAKEMGIVALANELIYIKSKATHDDSITNLGVFQNLRCAWSVMLGMLLVQDEYNKYNPNYKSKVK